MPPPPNKNKARPRDARSGSRHTTPGSNVSIPITSPPPTNTAFLDIPIVNLSVPPNVKYDDILERHGGNGGIPDPKHLETIATELRLLADAARIRSKYNDGGMRELSRRRKEAIEEEREREREDRERHEKRERSARRELERREAERRDVDMEDISPDKKNGKVKKKDRSVAREENPRERTPNLAAPSIAKPEALEIPVIGTSRLFTSNPYQSLIESSHTRSTTLDGPYH